jgi:membrane fusion protein (multidrug efflux system)
MILTQITIPALRNIYPGMHGSAIIKVPSKKTLLVPKEAVVIRGNRSVVFTYENGLAKWNYVTVGRNNGVEIEIMEGLEKNVKVITSNNLQLAHEAVVKEKLE